MKKIRIAIADDHHLFRKGLIAQLEEIDGVEVIADVPDGVELLDIAEKIDPDLVFMDIKMPKMDGVETTKKLLEKYPKIRVVALSMFGEEEYLQSMLDAGAIGFLLKNIDPDELEKGIKQVMKGYSFFSNELLNVLTKMFVSGGYDKKKTPDVKLTKREHEVLELICKGHTNNEIAEILCLSQRTIDGHRANIISKVGAKNTVSLVTFAIKNKLVTLG